MPWSWPRPSRGPQRRSSGSRPRWGGSWACYRVAPPRLPPRSRRIGARCRRRRENLERLGDGADALLAAVLAGALALLVHHHQRQVRMLIATSLAQVTRAMARHDGGEVLFGTLGRAALERLERQGALLGAVWDAVVRAAADRLRDADAVLERIEAVMGRRRRWGGAAARLRACVRTGGRGAANPDSGRGRASSHPDLRRRRARGRAGGRQSGRVSDGGSLPSTGRRWVRWRRLGETRVVPPMEGEKRNANPDHQAGFGAAGHRSRADRQLTCAPTLSSRPSPRG